MTTCYKIWNFREANSQPDFLTGYSSSREHRCSHKKFLYYKRRFIFLMLVFTLLAIWILQLFKLLIFINIINWKFGKCYLFTIIVYRINILFKNVSNIDEYKSKH